MKKFIKLLGVMVIIFGVVFALTGCGDDEDSRSSKKKDDDETISISSDNMLVGKMEEDGGTSKIEMAFDDDDMLTDLVLTYQFDDKDDADELYESSKEEVEGTNIKLKQDGKKVTIAFKAKDFADKFGTSVDSLDKAKMKQFASYMGYTLEN